MQEFEPQESSEEQQGQGGSGSSGSSRGLTTLGIILLILGLLAGVLSLGHGGGKPAMTPLSGIQTTAGTGSFSPKQDALLRLQEVNQFRIDAAATVSANNATVKASGSGQIQQLEQGNLGMA